MTQDLLVNNIYLISVRKPFFLMFDKINKEILNNVHIITIDKIGLQDRRIVGLSDGAILIKEKMSRQLAREVVE